MVFTLIIVLINFVSLTYLLIFTGTKVRVSKNTGTIIPKPDPMANRKPRSSMIGPKDTLPEDVFAVTYDQYDTFLPYIYATVAKKLNISGEKKDKE